MAYFDGFNGEVGVSEQFCAPEALDYEILVAVYSYENYEGSAYVLAKKDGNLFEVEGGHCSCYGLEGQWKPTEVSVEYLKNRLVHGVYVSGCENPEALNEAIRAVCNG